MIDTTPPAADWSHPQLVKLSDGHGAANGLPEEVSDATQPSVQLGPS